MKLKTINLLKDNVEEYLYLSIWKNTLNKKIAFIEEMIGKLDYIKIDSFYFFRVKRQVIDWEKVT